MQDEMNDLQYTKPEDPDIVKVVRCKDCKYWERSTPFENCVVNDRATDEDDYCSYGERKDEPPIH